jgi:hypothetical protein
LLDEAGKDERAFDGVGAAALAPTPMLVGLDLNCVIAANIYVNARRNAIGENRFEQFLQRIVAFDFKVSNLVI